MTRIAATLTVRVTTLLVLFFRFAQDRQEAQRDSIAPKKQLAQPAAIGHPTFVSPHANPIAISGDRDFVANTPAATIVLPMCTVMSCMTSSRDGSKRSLPRGRFEFAPRQNSRA
jgi:hypothetical protein